QELTRAELFERRTLLRVLVRLAPSRVDLRCVLRRVSPDDVDDRGRRIPCDPRVGEGANRGIQGLAMRGAADAADRPVNLYEVDKRGVGEVRHRDVGDRAYRRVQIQRLRQLRSSAGEESLVLFRALAIGNVTEHDGEQQT